MIYLHIKDIETILSAVKIQDFFSYYVFYEKQLVVSAKLRKILPAEVIRSCLVHALAQKLYTNFYCKGSVSHLKSLPPGPVLASERAIYLNELSCSNKGRGYLEEDWRIIARQANKIAVVKNGLKFILDESQYHLPAGMEERIGVSVFQRMPKERPFLSPGFFTVFGNIDFTKDDDSQMIRFYWNIKRQGAAPLMLAITAALNDAALPFRFKILDQPNQFNRCDAAVLYMSKGKFDLVGDIIGNIYSKVLPCLNNETPLFTKNLLPGLGLAEGPRTGMSFGIHRCGILAEAIVRAYELGKKTIAKRLEIARQCFDEEQLSIERPYLNPGSVDIFNFGSKKISEERGQGRTYQKPTDQLLLETALRIGERLSSKAIWHKDRCTWMALTPLNSNQEDEQAAKTMYSSVGPDLYSGTSGIALFLGELYLATGDRSMKRLSMGAMKQAVATKERIPAPLSLALYNGLSGISFASALLARLLGEQEFMEHALEIMKPIFRGNRQGQALDQMSGIAGAINAMLSLRTLLGDDAPLPVAISLGDQLIQKAICRDNYCSWRSEIFPKQQNLLGFSHGTSGIAHSLIALHQVTGNEEYRKFAELAFNYEHRWYNEQMNNWPDFRGIPTSFEKKITAMNFPLSWCHGAPGIALSRLLAQKVLKLETYKSEALTALTTTQKGTQRMIAQENVNFCLCHGLSGNGDILLTGGLTLGKGFPSFIDMAFQVASVGITRYSQNNSWPFAALGNNSPGLMLGLSGVGYFYLRLYNNKIPSMLAIENQDILARINSESTGFLL